MIDRQADLFKVAQGEWVSPSRVESALLLSPLVQQVCVVLANGVLMALVVPVPGVLNTHLQLASDTPLHLLTSAQTAQACAIIKESFVAAATAAKAMSQVILPKHNCNCSNKDEHTFFLSFFF